jgi:hypothetical protein
VDKHLVSLPLREGDSLAEFPVSLTIELVSFNEDAAAILSGFEKDQVGRDSLTLSNLDDLADFYIFGGDRHNRTHALLLARQNCVLRIVQIFVSAEPIEVVKSFFDHRHDQYEGKRCDVGEKEANFQEGDELTHCDQQEEQVEEEFELIEEHFRDESEDVVLLVVKLVGNKVAWRGPSYYA